MDLIFGPFADRFLPGLNETELDQLEGLLQVPDPLVYQWLTQKSEPPSDYKSDLLRKLTLFIHAPEKL